MMYTEFTVGKKTLKLRLTTRTIVALEKKLGKNPLSIFNGMQHMEMPLVSDIIMLLHASLQALEHGYTEDMVYDLYDEYIEDGHDIRDIIEVIYEVFQASGLLKKEEEASPNTGAGK